MTKLFIGSVLLVVIASGMFPGWVVTCIALILAAVNVVAWIIGDAGDEEDFVPPRFMDDLIDEFEADDAA